MTDILACTNELEALKKTENKIGGLIKKYDDNILLSYEVVEKLRQLHIDLITLNKNLKN